jgi:GNAT superfamily N-acetyltransferase
MFDKQNTFFLHELAMNAWPPTKIVFCNGWLLRLSEGITNRANSVLPLSYFGTNLGDDIKFVERIYQKQNLIPTFQLPDSFQPSNLLERLLVQGYRQFSETMVMKTPLSSVSRIPLKDNCRFVVNQETTSFITALQLLSEAGQERLTGTRKIIERIVPTKAFFYIFQKNLMVACGLAVSDRSFLGLFNIHTHTDCRRQGFAQSLIMQMLNWGEQNGAKMVYLQVTVQNKPAIALYRKLGFQKDHSYCYLQKTNANQ